MRTGRIVRQWQDEFGPFPPYRLDADALFVGYMLSAEFGCHIALGWGQPACALDPYVEFRHFMNDGAVKSGEREKGFYSLNGALRYFCENGIDTAHKNEMRDRIIQGPPFTAERTRNHLELLRRGRASAGAPGQAHRSDHQIAAARHDAREVHVGRSRSRSAAASRSICRSSLGCVSGGTACKAS